MSTPSTTGSTGMCWKPACPLTMSVWSIPPSTIATTVPLNPGWRHASSVSYQDSTDGTATSFVITCALPPSDSCYLIPCYAFFSQARRMLSKYSRDDNYSNCSGSSTSSSSRTMTWSRKTRVAFNRCLRCYRLGTYLFTHHHLQQARRVQHSPSPPVSPNASRLFISLTPDQSHSLMTSALSFHHRAHDWPLGSSDNLSYDMHIRSFVGLLHALAQRTLSRLLLLTQPSSNQIFPRSVAQLLFSNKPI
ncbi:hypothetical protein C8F01DRAFT_276658 [Mycena amicta]|nr:hypothetical protein C8F01DRAFT_276658 [Mycena amicta]